MNNHDNLEKNDFFAPVNQNIQRTRLQKKKELKQISENTALL